MDFYLDRPIIALLVVLLLVVVVLPAAWLVRRKRLDEYREYVKHREAVAKQARGGQQL